MYIKLWGVRGSIPSPINSVEYRQRLVAALEFARASWKESPDRPAANILEDLPPDIATLVGGETTCIEVRAGDDFLILDMGTGARRLGYEIMARGVPEDLHILLTHTHWDHIQGWPFFIPGYLPSSHVHFYSDMPDLENRFIRQQNFENFPVEFEQMASRRTFHTITGGGEFSIGPFRIRSHHLKHPGGVLSYRIEHSGSSFVFATDTEYFGDNLKDQIESSRPFFQDSDLLLMDAQYTMEDAAQRVGWGHTPTQNTVECALAWGVKHCILTHHEPSYMDEKVMELYENGLQHLQKLGNPQGMRLDVGVEGNVYKL